MAVTYYVPSGSAVDPYDASTPGFTNALGAIYGSASPAYATLGTASALLRTAARAYGNWTRDPNTAAPSAGATISSVVIQFGVTKPATTAQINVHGESNISTFGTIHPNDTPYLWTNDGTSLRNFSFEMSNPSATYADMAGANTYRAVVRLYNPDAVSRYVTLFNLRAVVTWTVAVSTPTLSWISPSSVATLGDAAQVTCGCNGPNWILPTTMIQHFDGSQWWNTQTTFGSGGSCSCYISSFTPAGTHYFRLYQADCTDGIYYSGQLPFTVPPGVSLPGVTTNAYSNLLTTSVTLSGTITSNGGGTISAAGICLSAATDSTNPTLANVVLPASHLTVGVPYYYNVIGLDPGILFYNRAYVTNQAGTSYGVSRPFTTLTMTPKSYDRTGSGSLLVARNQSATGSAALVPSPVVLTRFLGQRVW